MRGSSRKRGLSMREHAENWLSRPVPMSTVKEGLKRRGKKLQMEDFQMEYLKNA